MDDGSMGILTDLIVGLVVTIIGGLVVAILSVQGQSPSTRFKIGKNAVVNTHDDHSSHVTVNVTNIRHDAPSARQPRPPDEDDGINTIVIVVVVGVLALVAFVFIAPFAGAVVLATVAFAAVLAGGSLVGAKLNGRLRLPPVAVRIQMVLAAVLAAGLALAILLVEPGGMTLSERALVIQETAANSPDGLISAVVTTLFSDWQRLAFLVEGMVAVLAALPLAWRVLVDAVALAALQSVSDRSRGFLTRLIADFVAPAPALIVAYLLVSALGFFTILGGVPWLASIVRP